MRQLESAFPRAGKQQLNEELSQRAAFPANAAGQRPFRHYVTTAEGILTSFNPSAEQLLGYARWKWWARRVPASFTTA